MHGSYGFAFVLSVDLLLLLCTVHDTITDCSTRNSGNNEHWLFLKERARERE